MRSFGPKIGIRFRRPGKESLSKEQAWTLSSHTHENIHIDLHIYLYKDICVFIFMNVYICRCVYLYYKYIETFLSLSLSWDETGYLFSIEREMQRHLVNAISRPLKERNWNAIRIKANAEGKISFAESSVLWDSDFFSFLAANAKTELLRNRQCPVLGGKKCLPRRSSFSLVLH